MALIIYSGGLDSTVMLYEYAKHKSVNMALSFDYGQKHRRELDMAKWNCARLGIEHKVLDLSCLKQIFGKSSLTDIDVAVPEGHYESLNMKSTVVPNRNMIMISIAAAQAISIDSSVLAYAAHGGDHAIYPDCRPEFIDAMRAVLKLCDYKKLELETPFVNKSKAEIVSLGQGLGVDFSKTWSCYKGGELHCGKCGTCVERKEAFLLAGIQDPTIYA